MRARLIVFLAVLLAAGPARAETLPGTVVAVPSADTLHIAAGEAGYTVRMFDIRPPLPADPAAAAAQAALSGFALGRVAEVESVGRDVEGRVLGRVRIDGLDLADRMVRGGHARAGADPALQQAEAEARAAGRGMWRRR